MNDVIARPITENTLTADIEFTGMHLNLQNLSIPLILPLEKKHNLLIKRIIDVCFSLVLIICILSWLIPVLAVVIKISSRGPLFFKQKRNGSEGNYFTCIKFRTMVVNKEADTLIAQENDERITKVGKYLRRHHLDELPQLFNVLKGEMSLIGPRPYMIVENNYYSKHIANYANRHNVKPGITGLAQSFGYFGNMDNTEEVKQRVELDMQYIHQWSLSMDFKIICRTFLLALGLQKEKKAYYKTG